MAYAIVKVGGKQYRVEKGDELVVDRLREDQGAKVALEPLMFRPDKGDPVIGGDDLGKIKVEATVKGHERGKKLHVLKYKPKRGYKRRTGHRSELTRLEIGEIKLLSRRPAAAQPKAETAAKPKAEPKAETAAKPRAEAAATPKVESAAAPKAEPKKAPARKPAEKKDAATKKPATGASKAPADKKTPTRKAAPKKPAAREPAPKKEGDDGS
jgi:large subunit ribosomal protein L21